MLLTRQHKIYFVPVVSKSEYLNNRQFSDYRPEVKEGKEGETEKTAEQENNESDKIEKELEKDKVR